MVHYAKVHLCNGELAKLTIETDDISSWIDEVVARGIQSNDIYIPSNSITYILFKTREERDVEDLEVEFEQD